MPQVSEDKKTYTFRIKKGVRFIDDPCFPDGKGREVTAQDFLFCFKRFGHPQTKAKGWWLFDGWIQGFDTWRKGLREDLASRFESTGKQEKDVLWGLDRPLEGIEVLDRYTLRFHLTKPYPQFLWVLAMPYTSVYPEEAVRHYGDEIGGHPVGTGPFMVTEFNPVYRVVYKQNPNYREERVPDPRNHPQERWPGWEEDEKAGYLVDAGKRIPLLDGIETRFIVEDQPRWLYFKSGYTDFLSPPKDNTDEAIPGGKLSDEMRERGTRLFKWPELGTVYTCLNTEDEILSNVDLRRAIAMAFDHQWTVDNLYSGSAVVATSLIPPGVAGFDAEDLPYHRKDGHADLDRARKLLVKAGYPGGKDPKTGRSLRLVFENSGSSKSSRDFGNRFVDEMRRIGIDVDVIVNTFPQMIDKMRKKNFQVAGLAWGFDYPDAQNILQLLYGPNESPGINAANFKDPEFDRLYEKISTMEDSPERTVIYERMAHIVADQVPWITRAHRIKLNLQQAWLRGFKFTQTSYQYWRYSNIDVEQRKTLVKEWNRPNRLPMLLVVGAFVVMILTTVLKARL